MTFTLKTSFETFRIQPWLTNVHHHTKFGRKMYRRCGTKGHSLRIRTLIVTLASKTAISTLFAWHSGSCSYMTSWAASASLLQNRSSGHTGRTCRCRHRERRGTPGQRDSNNTSPHPPPHRHTHTLTHTHTQIRYKGKGVYQKKKKKKRPWRKRLTTSVTCRTTRPTSLLPLPPSPLPPPEKEREEPPTPPHTSGSV